MMYEPDAIAGELARQLAQIRINGFRFNMYERIEAKDEINSVIGDHLQRCSIVKVISDVRIILKTFLASVDAVWGQIDDD